MAEDIKYLVIDNLYTYENNAENIAPVNRKKSISFANVAFYEKIIQDLGYVNENSGGPDFKSFKCWILDCKKFFYCRSKYFTKDDPLDIGDTIKNSDIFTDINQLEVYTESIKHRFISKKFGI